MTVTVTFGYCVYVCDKKNLSSMKIDFCEIYGMKFSLSGFLHCWRDCETKHD